ncbi:MAG TPA: biotin--[acetyl-CoA-carboxylase] ligase, partial [Planctomycetes bacterium]|nr:biotin--[acetyl-CoA-carboxylase] ligase [Planctomycetota bacterium]
MASSDLDLARILHCSWVATVEWYDTIESTNDRAKQLAIRRAGPLPALIVAGRQTAGRGRGTRRWWT